MDEVMDTQRSYVTYPKSHSTLVAALGLNPKPLGSKFGSPSCCNTAPPRIKVIRWIVGMGNRHQAKKGKSCLEQRVGNKREGKERRKGEKGGKEFGWEKPKRDHAKGR